jgi:hypothetical protein
MCWDSLKGEYNEMVEEIQLRGTRMHKIHAQNKKGQPFN